MTQNLTEDSLRRKEDLEKTISEEIENLKNLKTADKTSKNEDILEMIK